MKLIAISVPALLALTACDGGTQSAGITTEEAEAEGNIVGNSSASKPADPIAGEAPATGIPAAIQGRWGLVAADCEPGRADAKGLLTITADRLEFYESVGTLGEVEDSGAERIRARFDFTGEGMTWQRGIELAAEERGEALVRREFGPDAAAEPFRYTRCNQGR